MCWGFYGFLVGFFLGGCVVDVFVLLLFVCFGGVVFLGGWWSCVCVCVCVCVCCF